MPTTDPPRPDCATCRNERRVPIGEHFVTREMAMDASEPSMEGMSAGVEWGPCPDCSPPRPLTEQEQAEMEDAMSPLDDFPVLWSSERRARAWYVALGRVEALVRRCGDAIARAERAEAERDEARFTAERLRNTIITAPAFPVTQAEADSIACLSWERPDAAEGAR